MITLDFHHSDEIAAWVAERISYVGHRGFGPCAAIGVLRDGSLIAGCVYHNFRDYGPGKRAIELSFAADYPYWAKKGVISALLAYPFNQLGCIVVMTTIPRKNKKARRLQTILGFGPPVVVKNGYGFDDAFVYTMERHQAERWLKTIEARKSNGQGWGQRAVTA